jgi:hypothetical protein
MRGRLASAEFTTPWLGALLRKRLAVLMRATSSRSSTSQQLQLALDHHARLFLRRAAGFEPRSRAHCVSVRGLRSRARCCDEFVLARSACSPRSAPRVRSELDAFGLMSLLSRQISHKRLRFGSSDALTAI